MDFVKKNKTIVGVVVVLVLILAGIGFFVLGRGGGKTSQGPTGDQMQNVKAIKPEDIGLTLALAANKQSVNMTVTKLAGVKSIEYEVSYDAEETTEGETATVPKGVIGSPITVAGESEIKRDITLGTCSASKCRYDKVKSDIKFVLKVTYDNSEIGSVETSVPFN